MTARVCPHHLRTIPGNGITTRTLILILDHGLVALALDHDLHLHTPWPARNRPWPCTDHNLNGNPAHTN
ncbi:hypothetical protein [Streptacidiphilus carbonis]|uniref:hypothetical protein n=1 Tax=Streptacidiphilus carbonis TaxID=105422 RepID=UPI0012699CB7|nr:hypothetical protein [Streptacidiphilus carbonis]